MKVTLDEFYREYYEQGHMDDALNEMSRWGSVDGWVEHLKHESICYSENDDEWTLMEKNGTKRCKWTDTEDNSTAEFEVGLLIELGDDTLLHCPNGNASYFFQQLGDGKLRAIYID